MNNLRKMIFTALLIALGIVLPMMVHTIPNAGSVLLPMHIPILICGMICGFPYGLAAGILTPLLSSMLTGMPPAAFLPSMVLELATYGLVSGILAHIVRTKSNLANIYITLIGSMLAGRIVYGILNALIFRAGEYSAQIWLTSAFVTALPGVIIQLILIPAIVVALQRARLVRYYRPESH